MITSANRPWPTPSSLLSYWRCWWRVAGAVRPGRPRRTDPGCSGPLCDDRRTGRCDERPQLAGRAASRAGCQVVHHRRVVVLLAMGGLIGVWNLFGTIPTLVYYGIQVLSPSWYYAATALSCGVIALAIEYRQRPDRVDQGSLARDGERILQQLRVAEIDQLLSRGGLAGMLMTAWLIALVLPSRVFRLEFAKRGFAPMNLSRLAADSDRDLRARPVELVRHVHGRGSRCTDAVLHAVCGLQLRQPRAERALRHRRLQDRESRAVAESEKPA